VGEGESEVDRRQHSPLNREHQVFCNGIQFALETPDEAITDDLELLQDLHDNICAVYDIDCD